jgi:hypothetical protein
MEQFSFKEVSLGEGIRRREEEKDIASDFYLYSFTEAWVFLK